MQQGTFRVYGQTKETPAELAQDVPVFRGETGELEYGMPENYGWFDAFMDRRTYAVTAGGVGKTIGGFRNPARYFYEEGSWFNEGNGRISTEEQDPQWVKYVQDEAFRGNILKNTRSMIGTSEALIEQEFGEDAVENALRESVSNDNFISRITFMQDAVEARARFEAYDESSKWSTFIASKGASLVENYMFVDAPTTIMTGVSIVTGTGAAWIPYQATARSGMLANLLTKMPLVTNGTRALRTWSLNNRYYAMGANVLLEGGLGGASGYAYWKGYNEDRQNLLGRYAILDENPLDDIGMGMGLGVLGGLWSWHVNDKTMTRAAAIESVAMNNLVTGLPTEASVEYATRLVISHERLIKQARAAGLDKANPLKFKEITDIQHAANNYGLNPQNIDAIVEIMRRENIGDWKDMDALLNASIVAEHNAGKALKNRIVTILTDAGIPHNPDNIDYVANRDVIARGLRETPIFSQEESLGVAPTGEPVMAGIQPPTEARVEAAARARVGPPTRKTIGGVMMDVIADMRKAGTITMDGAKFLNRFDDWLATRTGGTPIDFYRWAYMRSQDITGFKEELGMLMKFVNDTTDEEIAILNKYGLGGDDLLSNLMDRARSNIDFDTGADVPLMTRGTLLSNSAAFNSLPEAMKPIVREIDDLLVRLGQTERDFHLNLTTTTGGSPIPRLREIVKGNKYDQKLVNRILRLLDNMERLAGTDPNLKAIVANQRAATAAQRVRNELTRVRIKNGLIADEGGFFNTLIHFMGKGKQYADGTMPLRTSSSVRGMTGIDVDADAAAANTNARLNATINDIGRAGPLPTTKMQRNVAAAATSIDVAKNVSAIIKRIIGESRAGGTPSADIAVHLNALKSAGALRVVSQTRLDEALVKEGIMDASGVVDVAKVLKMNDDEYFTRAVSEAKNKLNQVYAGDVKSQREALGLLDFAMPSEWNFANVNAVSKALDETFGLNAIGTLIREVYRITNWMDGESAKLWFNRRAITNTAIDGMDSYNRVLFFANLIDSPHTVRRDFGNIIDRRLFSAQQIRHFNAREANGFVNAYEAILRDGIQITREDEVAVINALLSPQRRLPQGASIAQERLYDAFQDYFKVFRNDVEVIFRRSNYFNQTVRGGLAGERAVRQAVDNTIRRMLLGELDQGRVLLNRGRIKDIMRNHMLRVIDDSITRLETGPAQHGFGTQIDQAIANANTRAELRNAFRQLVIDNDERAFKSWVNKTGHAQLNDLIESMTDGEIAAMTNLDDFITKIRTDIRPVDVANTNGDFLLRINNMVDDLFERHIDPSQGFSPSNRTNLQGRSTFEFASFRAGMDPTEEGLMDDILSQLGEFRSDSLTTMVTDFASGTAVRLRMQAQISRHVGDVNIFKVLDDTRKHLKQVARNIERRADVPANMKNIVKETENTMDFLEMRMAHALGLTIETPEGAAIRSGWRESALKMFTSGVRITAGGKFGLASFFSDIPKAFIDAWGRQGFIVSVRDLVTAAMSSKGAFADLGASLEKYSHKYAIGLDNDRPMARVQVPRQFRVGARGGATNTFVNETVGLGGLVDQAAEVVTVGPVRRNAINMFRSDESRSISMTGIEAARLQRGAPQTGVVGRTATVAARGIDATNQAMEELGDFAQKAGGIQYANTIPKHMTARATNRQFVSNIKAIIAFADELSRSNLSAMPWEQRLPAFQKLARKYGLSVYQASRLNHHGLLNPDDLVAFANAIKKKGILDSTGVYDSTLLRNELDRLYPNRQLDTDEFFRRMTTYLEEEANRTVNMASVISADPQAGHLKRFFTRFSGFTRGWQQQSLLRGMQDNSIGMNMIRMLVPILVGEQAYSIAKKILSGGKDGKQTPQEIMDAEMRDLEENLPIRLAETMSKIPIGSTAQSVLFSYGINPFLNTTSQYRREQIADFIGGSKEAYPDIGLPGTSEMVDQTGTGTRYFGPSSPISEWIMGAKKGPEKVIPQPFGGIFSQLMSVGDTFSDNPYLDNSVEYGYNFPNGYLYSMIPGRHSWLVDAFLRTSGYAGKEEYNSRAARFDQGR